MSLEKAKLKLTQLLPILTECFHQDLANELLQPAMWLVDSELEKQEAMAKYRGYTDEQLQASLAEDQEAAIRRMQEEAAAQLLPKAAKANLSEDPEAPDEGATGTPEYEEFLQWKAEKAAAEDAELEAKEAEEKAAAEAAELEAKEAEEKAAAEAEKAPKKATSKVAKKEDVTNE